MNQIFINNNTYDIAPYPIDIEPSVTAKRRNIGGANRDILRITVYGVYAQVINDFVNNAIFCIKQQEFDDEGNEVYVNYDKSNYNIAGDVVDHRDGRITVYMIEPSEQDITNEAIIQLRTELVDYPELMAKFVTIYPKWEIKYHVKDTIVNHDGVLYICIQAHTSTGDPSHTPDVTPALWKRYFEDDETPDWKQPTGSHDAYNIGDKVKYIDKIYKSKIDGNTTVPGSDDRWWELMN